MIKAFVIQKLAHLFLLEECLAMRLMLHLKRTAATHLLNRHNFCSKWTSKGCIRLLLCMALFQSQSRKRSQYTVILQGETHKRGPLYHSHTHAHRITPL